jgi:DNA polymerase-3 subunit delta
MPSDAQRMSVERLIERLASKKPVPGVTLLGTESYLREMCRSRLIETYTQEGTRDWSVTNFSAEDDSADRVIGQAQSLPMLAPRQVVLWKDVEALEQLGEKARDAALECLESYLGDPAPFTILVLEAAQLDQRMRLFKLLSEKTLVVDCELSGEPEEREGVAALMAVEMASGSGIELDRAAAQLLSESTNAGLARMRTEIEKLASYAGERKHITRADVAAMVVSEKRYTVWQLSEMLANGDRARALAFLESLLDEGEQPVAIVGAMAWMYRKLLEAQELGHGANAWQAARQLGMRRETAEIAVREARRIPREQLALGLAALAETDNRLKSGSTAPKAVMEFLVARLTGARSASAATKK